MSMNKNAGIPPRFLVKAAGALSHALMRASLKLMPPQFAILEVVTSRWRHGALGVVARLGVAERLRDGPRSIADLAAELRVDEGALYRVLRALSRDGIFEEQQGRCFALNAASRPLLADDPASMRGIVMSFTPERENAVWSKLGDAVRTGRPVMEELYGESFWAYLERHPDEGRVFHQSMVEFTRDLAQIIAAAWDFKSAGSLCDVGGGAGELLATIVARHPGLQGVCFDVTSALDGAPATFARHGVSDRCMVEAGDHFAHVPEGHGAYLMKNIVHGLDGDGLSRALGSVRAAMRDDAKLLLVEHVVPPSGAYMAFLDLQMLLSTGGRERTREEFEAMLHEHGFRMDALIETASPMSLIVASRKH
jgi:hypothetical protein